MAGGQETGVTIDAAGLILTWALADRLIGKLIEASGQVVTLKGGDAKMRGVTIISHPAQRNAYMACLYGMAQSVEDAQKLDADFVHNGADWIIDPGFPKDRLRVEFLKVCGEITHLATLGL